MTIKQFVQNADVKLNLFSWSWATKDPEKFHLYNVLLNEFLTQPEVAELHWKRKVYFFWNLYCGYLQNYVLNNENEKPEIIAKCPLPESELKRLFS